jgi:succinyl-CoA synthetase beta subunit
MKLMEFQSSRLFSEYGIPVPEGEVAEDPESVAAVIRRWGAPGVIKAQVLAGGRGKAGGVKVAKDPEEALVLARGILGLKIKGYPVEKVYVARVAKMSGEYYLCILVNRGKKAVEAVFCESGGMEIEQLAAARPGELRYVPIDPVRGLDGKAFMKAIRSRLIGKAEAERVNEVAQRLWRLFSEKDCSMAEINPLAVTEGGALVAVDAKVVIDDNALFKHPELEALRNPEEYSSDEVAAREAGLSFVGMDGSIGCMVNGAGLSMATMDLIKHFGAEPANFLDIGGSSNPEKVVAGLRILLGNPKVKAILINIFGGITRCDDVAKGLLEARERIDIKVPMVIRLIGTNDEAARAILLGAGIEAYNDLPEAIKKVVSYVGGRA